MQQVHFFSIIVFISLAIGSIALFIIRLFIQLQRRKNEASKQFSLLAEVTEQEKEKARITEQLHEDFGATLSIMKMLLSNFVLNSEREREQRQMVMAQIDSLMTKIRAIEVEYLPFYLQQKKLVSAIDQYMRYINTIHPALNIQMLLPDNLPELSIHQVVSIYRIIQEISDNTLRHSGATEILIALKQEVDMLLLAVGDNGRGFDYEQALEQKRGMGLNNIMTRVNLLKAAVKVVTKPGGVLYALEIPLA